MPLQNTVCLHPELEKNIQSWIQNRPTAQVIFVQEHPLEKQFYHFSVKEEF